MKKNFCRSVVLMMLIFALCTGCAQYAVGDEIGATVTGGAISGAAVTGTAISQGSQWKYFFANDTNVYLEDYEEDEAGFVQYKKTGEKQVRYIRPIAYDALLAVTEEGVYYARSYFDRFIGENGSELCRIPIEKNADGTDRLKMDAIEVIVKEESGIIEDNAYIDENYIVYNAYGEYIVKYNRKTKEKIKLETISNINTILASGQDYLIIVSEYGGYLRLDLDGNKLERFGGNKSGNTYHANALHGEYFFYQEEKEAGDYPEDEIWVYDGKNKTKQRLLTEKQLEEACRQVPLSSAPLKIKDKGSTSFYLTEMFCEGDRLYIQAQLNRYDGKREWMCYAVFSMDISDLNRSDTDKTELRYEKDLMKCIWSHSSNKFYKITEGDDEAADDGYGEYDEVAWNPGRVVGVQDGRAILILNPKDDYRQSIVCYDLKTDKFSKITIKDKEYLTLYYNKKYPLGEPGGDLDELEDNEMDVMPEFLTSYC